VVTEPSGAVKRTAYIAGVATVIETDTGTAVTSETRYLLKDHLGSTDVMTSSTGTVLTRYSFDAHCFARGDSRSESRPPRAEKGQAPPDELDRICGLGQQLPRLAERAHHARVYSFACTPPA